MKVAVCIPVKAGIHPYAMASLTAMLLTARGQGHMAALLTTDHCPVANARNDLIRKAMAMDPDWILCADSDHTFPPDALLRLMAHDRDVVATFYPARKYPHTVIGLLVDRGAPPRGVQRAKQFGMGLVLLRPNVFKRVPFPWFYYQYGVEHPTPDNPEGYVSEDITFCRNLMASGVEAWADLDLSYEIGHICETVVKIELPGEMAGSQGIAA